jgi:hypothetical protein
MRRFLHHFKYGSLPYDSSEEYLSNNRQPLSVAIPVHQGPLETAIRDAVIQRQLFLIYIYCRENALTRSVNNVLASESVSALVERNFLFVVLDISYPEGWTAAHFFNFKTTPVISVLRPRGSTLKQCHLIVKHEGSIGETALLSYLSIAVQEDGTVIETQDAEYQKDVQEVEENTRRVDELDSGARQAEINSENVDREFEAIPTPVDGAEAIAIRFHFPDSSTQTRKFCHDASARALFSFVRHFVFPERFAMVIPGFPAVKIAEEDGLVRSVCRDRHFVVYVEFED